MPTIRRACYASCLLAEPGVQEPIFLGDCTSSTSRSFMMLIFGSGYTVPRRCYRRCI